MAPLLLSCFSVVSMSWFTFSIVSIYNLMLWPPHLYTASNTPVPTPSPVLMSGPGDEATHFPFQQSYDHNNPMSIPARHPDHNCRPRFSDICDYLSSPDETLLYWSHEDRIVSPSVIHLGAPLSEARNLYPDLQFCHCDNNTQAVTEV